MGLLRISSVWPLPNANTYYWATISLLVVSPLLPLVYLVLPQWQQAFNFHFNFRIISGLYSIPMENYPRNNVMFIFVDSILLICQVWNWLYWASPSQSNSKLHLKHWYFIWFCKSPCKLNRYLFCMFYNADTITLLILMTAVACVKHWADNPFQMSFYI